MVGSGMWVVFAITVAFVVVAVAYMIAVLPAPGVPAQVKAVVGCAWLTTLMICCVVPIDVYSTLKGSNPPAIGVLWDVSYWSTQLLTWFLIPTYMGYADAGEFTWKARMLESIRSNGFFLLSMSCAGTVGAIWAVYNSSLRFETLPSLGKQLANTFGLCCVLTLLGYGLVAIPRCLWKRSNPEQELRHQLYRLGRVVEERAAAQKLLQDALHKIASTKRALGNAEWDSHRRVDTIIAYIQQRLSDVKINAQGGTAHVGMEYTDELPRLNKEIKRDVSWVVAVQAQLEIVLRKACHLTEVVSSRRSSGFIPSPAGESPWQRTCWACSVAGLPVLYRLLAMVAAVTSAVILIGEITVGFSANLSPISHLIHATQSEHWTQLIILVVLMYFIACTYTAFFSINVGATYILLPRASSAFSLLFNATLMARFAAPLCYNFLHVIAMDRATPDGNYTVFAQHMGVPMDDDIAIPFLGTSFNRWAPMVVLLVGVLTMCNAFGKLYRWLTSVLVFMPQAFDASDDSSHSESNAYVADGERIVQQVRQAAAADGQAVSAAMLREHRAAATTGLLTDNDVSSGSGSGSKSSWRRLELGF